MKTDQQNGARRPTGRSRKRRSICVLTMAAVCAGAVSLYLSQNRGGIEPGEVSVERSDGVPARKHDLGGQDVQLGAIDNGATDSGSARPQRTAEAAFWEQVERDRKQASTKAPPKREHESTRRQTSFDETNYAPPKQVNIIQSVPVRSTDGSAGGDREALTGSKTATVRWEDARGNRSSWKTRFEYRAGRIDNSSFCLNIGKGSIPYRECRKGARKWLKEQCRSDRRIEEEWRQMYCQAHGSYRT
ncbi:MAG: hypothetical protein JKY26_07065 [Pseudomonas sp.]|nr:hypothetical protein [Pseudomonas sp.]